MSAAIAQPNAVIAGRWKHVDSALWVATVRGGAEHIGLVQRTPDGYDARDRLDRRIDVFPDHRSAARAVLDTYADGVIA
ncbi:hypothetical protein [Schumannella sp. 10F1B-5-1]|uniref:hypothetical protein n=1 Tax=Schumannella sp. 10F1B-5-1 TaxID=2590780 RepID=UPI0011326128|nr:hypothetical protein [Schumannella sp. 10F1B-5-1]TPW78339.1 hypothetical protein FJ658_00585 [Schumannella sp. 10F1B-5-1]